VDADTPVLCAIPIHELVRPTDPSGEMLMHEKYNL